MIVPWILRRLRKRDKQTAKARGKLILRTMEATPKALIQLHVMAADAENLLNRVGQAPPTPTVKPVLHLGKVDNRLA